jgi:hypothetical protein
MNWLWYVLGALVLLLLLAWLLGLFAADENDAAETTEPATTEAPAAGDAAAGDAATEDAAEGATD